jgi:hypothetical protein
MALSVAQLINVPGGPGVVGGVKAGTNIAISADGTISTAGGFLPLTGGTLTGRLQVTQGTVSNASVGFTGSDPGTGIYSPSANALGFTIGQANTGFWITNQGNILAGKPEDVLPSYNLGGTTYQAWCDDTTVGINNAGGGLFYFGANEELIPRIRMCRGKGTIQNIQNFSTGDVGWLLFCESQPSDPTGIIRAKISAFQPGVNEATRLIFWNTLDGQNLPAERWQIGGQGNLTPWFNNVYDLGAPTVGKIKSIYLTNPPIVGEEPVSDIAPLAETLGLDYINSLEPVAYIHEVDGYEPGAEVVIPSSPTNWDAVTTGTLGEPIVGTTVNWGFRPSAVVELNASLGYLGNLGVAGVNLSPEGDEAYLSYEQLIAPMVKSIQQLSQQLTDLQTAFDDYVADHP